MDREGLIIAPFGQAKNWDVNVGSRPGRSGFDRLSTSPGPIVGTNDETPAATPFCSPGRGRPVHLLTGFASPPGSMAGLTRRVLLPPKTRRTSAGWTAGTSVILVVLRRRHSPRP